MQCHATQGDDSGEAEERARQKATLRKEKLDEDLDIVTSDDNRAKQVLKLEDIAFQSGGHLMANKTCKLPVGDALMYFKKKERRKRKMKNIAFFSHLYDALPPFKHSHLHFPSQNSKRIQHKGYEEILIPGLKPKPFDKNEALVKITSLPPWAQPAFAVCVCVCVCVFVSLKRVERERERDRERVCVYVF